MEAKIKDFLAAAKKRAADIAGLEGRYIEGLFGEFLSAEEAQAFTSELQKRFPHLTEESIQDRIMGNAGDVYYLNELTNYPMTIGEIEEILTHRI